MYHRPQCPRKTGTGESPWARVGRDGFVEEAGLAWAVGEKWGRWRGEHFGLGEGGDSSVVRGGMSEWAVETDRWHRLKKVHGKAGRGV